MQWKNCGRRVLAAIGALTCMSMAMHAQAQCTGYTAAAGPGTFVAGTTDVGNHGDDVTTPVALPFPVTFYGTSYNAVTVSSNGNLQFATTVIAYANTCLPSATIPGPAIFPFWDDLYTSGTAAGQGIFSGLSGVAPNRVFVLEWRTQNCCATTAYINNFEIKFYEGSNNFDIVYNAPIGTSISATVGCQFGGNAGDPVTQVYCNAAGVTSTTSLRFTCVAAATSGACCLNNGSAACLFTDASGCTASGGTFNGVGTTCTTLCAAHACCVTSGGCIIVGTTACPAGSTNQGAGTTCATNPCPGEDCTTAIVLGTGANVSGTGDLSNAGPTTVIANPVCATSSRDSFYSYTPAVSNSYAVTTCNAITGTLDTVLSVHSGCPGDSTTMLACNDDNCTGGVGPSTIASVQMDAGTTYIIRVARWNTGAGGPFRVDITSDPFGSCCLPAGTCQLSGQTACTTGGGTFAGGATCSTAACQGTCCNAATGACTLTGPTGCSTTFGGLGSSCTPNPCPGQACCNATLGTCTFTGTAACASGTTSQGIGTVCTPNPCPQPPPPGNDECTGAVALTLGTPVQGTLTQATGSDISTCSGSNIDVWYTFTAPVAGSYAATATLVNGGFIPAIAIYAATPCPVNLDSNDAAPAGCQAQGGTGVASRSGMAQGETILIRVADFGDSTAFSIVVSSIISGACCNNTTAACTTSNTGAAGCAAGTTYQGNNSTCTPVPCIGEACCNATTGVCVFGAAGACASGTTGQGSGSVCTPNPCPQPPPPANDECGATNPALTVGVSISATNIFATTSTTLTGTLCPNGLTASGGTNDVFFRFVAPATADYEANMCGSGFDTVLSVHSDCPATEAGLIACNDDSTNAGNTACTDGGTRSRIPHLALTAGTLYTVRAAGYGGATGAFNLVINYVGAVGSCCVSTTCTLTDAINCTGTFTSGGSCTPSPCGGPAGVCCRGSTCTTTVTTAAACTASLIPGQTAGASFPSAAGCNAAVVSNSPCCYADYNKQNGITVTDIFNFLTDWFAGSPYANVGGTGAAGPLAVQNIFDFLGNWFAGGC